MQAAGAGIELGVADGGGAVGVHSLPGLEVVGEKQLPAVGKLAVEINDVVILQGNGLAAEFLRILIQLAVVEDIVVLDGGDLIIAGAQRDQLVYRFVALHASGSSLVARS